MDRCGPLGRSARKDPAGDGAGPLRARLRLLGLRTPRRRRLSPETKREGGVSERSLGVRKPQAQLVRASGGFIRGGWGLRALPRRSKTSRPPCVCSCRVFKNPARGGRGAKTPNWRRRARRSTGGLIGGAGRRGASLPPPPRKPPHAPGSLISRFVRPGGGEDFDPPRGCLVWGLGSSINSRSLPRPASRRRGPARGKAFLCKPMKAYEAGNRDLAREKP